MDIIQAVGRVIRKAAGKLLGTIVIPVFIDESEDADTKPPASLIVFCGDIWLLNSYHSQAT